MSSQRSKRGKADDIMDSAERRSKRRRLSSSDEEEGSPGGLVMTPGVSGYLGGDVGSGINGMKTPSLSSHKHKPAELFRKDLISAMKLADSEPLQEEEYLLISDPWRQEWERGVQVPVNPSVIPEIKVSHITENAKLHGDYLFKMPRKMLHATKDETYMQGLHELHETQQLAEQVCRYDLDDHDVQWLQLVNAERADMGLFAISEYTVEKVMEELENKCHDNMKQMIKTVEGLGIEYDENVICDVCRSPDSEDNNEMVFCDNCDICVHQACYGIQKIPDGSWLCRVCALGIKPQCILCPNTGGAMKSTRSGTKWAHVSCALWIPEVSIGCVEKMEPVTKISQIPSSRWALICIICREKTGACIQCSVKTCKTAFHVTCAFRNGLEMRTILNEDNEEEDVKLQGYCSKHTKKRRDGDVTPRKGDTPGSPISPARKELTEEEKTELRSHRLHKLAEEFYTCVKGSEVAAALQLDEELVDFIYAYWLLKRKSNFNRPLLTPRIEEADLLSRQQEDSLVARMKMFVHLRQDLERVRNLCYMVSKREKMRRQLYRLKEEVFLKQVTLVDSSRISSRELPSIMRAHKTSNSIYDHPDLHLNQVEEVATTSDAESVHEPECKVRRSPASKADIKRKIMFERKAHEKRDKKSPKKKKVPTATLS